VKRNTTKSGKSCFRYFSSVSCRNFAKQSVRVFSSVNYWKQRIRTNSSCILRNAALFMDAVRSRVFVNAAARSKHLQHQQQQQQRRRRRRCRRRRICRIHTARVALDNEGRIMEHSLSSSTSDRSKITRTMHHVPRSIGVRPAGRCSFTVDRPNGSAGRARSGARWRTARDPQYTVRGRTRVRLPEVNAWSALWATRSIQRVKISPLQMQRTVYILYPRAHRSHCTATVNCPATRNILRQDF
jgi:hypothetical protein